MAVLDNPGLAGTPPSAWPTPALSRFVTANGTTLDNLRDLLEDEDWHPRHSSWHGRDLGAHTAWADLGLLLQAQAAYLARRADEEGAFTAAIDIAELSRRLQDIWAWPSFMQRAHELHAACAQTTAELLKITRLDSAQLQRFQDEFAKCLPADQTIQHALNAYYVHEKKLLLGRESGEPLDTMPSGIIQPRAGRFFFKTRDTLNLLANAFRDLKSDIAAPRYATVSQDARRASRRVPQFYYPNAAGERYFSQRIDRYLNLPEAHSLAIARHGLVTTLFAIRRHVADHQSLPATLDALRPAYLNRIPLDPFSGEPYRYEPLRGLLYSAGTDLIAAGGQSTQPPLLDPREPTLEVGIVPTPLVR